jgi:hypothetical protein
VGKNINSPQPSTEGRKEKILGETDHKKKEEQ